MSPPRPPGRRLRAVGVGLVLLALSPSAVSETQALGRLFSTRDERVRLDELRRDHDDGAAVREQASSAPGQGRVASQLTVEGVVLRSGGQGTVWINGEQVSSDGGVTRAGMIVHAPPMAGSRVDITLPSGADMQLKPGQKFDVASGGVLEPYQIKAGDDAASAFQDEGSSADSPEGGMVEAAKDVVEDAVEVIKGYLPGR